MAETEARRINRVSTHPGTLMKEVLHEHLRLSTTEAAKLMGVTRQKLGRVLSKKIGLSPELALRFSAFVGSSAEMLLSMQMAHDLSRIRAKIAKKLFDIAQIRDGREK